MDAESTGKLAPLPWIVQFVAAMLLVFGAMWLCDALYKLIFFGMLVIELRALIALLLGYFLFRRSEAAYKITKFFIWLTQFGVVVGIVVLIAGMFCYGSIWIPSDSSSELSLNDYFGPWWGVVAVFIFAFLFMFLWYVIRVWRRPETEAIFITGPKPKDTGKWASVLIVMGVVLGVSWSAMDYRCRWMVKQVYRYDAVIQAADSKTGELIEGFGFGLPSKNSANREFFGHEIYYVAKDGGIGVKGKSIVPLEVEVTANGYKPATVVIEPGEETYTVEMERQEK